MHHINYKKLSSFEKRLLQFFLLATFVYASVLIAVFPSQAVADGCSPGFVWQMQDNGKYGCVSQSYQEPKAVTQRSITQNNPRGSVFGSAMDGGNNSQADAGNRAGADAGNTSRADAGNRTTLMNPLKFGTFPEFFKGLIEILIIFAIPIIVLMIIYAGFLYVMAQGSEEQVTKATRALTYAVLGGLLIIGAELILRVIQSTVNQLKI